MYKVLFRHRTTSVGWTVADVDEVLTMYEVDGVTHPDYNRVKALEVECRKLYGIAENDLLEVFKVIRCTSVVECSRIKAILDALKKIEGKISCSQL